MKRFVSLAELPREEVLDLLTLAAQLERRPDPHALAGRVLALLFFNPSLRTLASFQSAMARLGGNSFVISPGQGSWQLETRRGVVMNGDAAEHVREAVPVLASYADALGIRSFAGGRDLAADLADATFRAMASVCPVPLINLESAVDHPCQALADWKTMDDLGLPRHGRFVLSWACHPKPLPLAVPAAALHMAALRGMEVVVARPHGYGLPAALMERARAVAELQGGSVRETNDPGEAMVGAQVLYAKSWASPELLRRCAGGGDSPPRARRLVRRRALVRRGGGRVPLHALPAGAEKRRGERRRARLAALGGGAGGAQPHVGADGGAPPAARRRRRRRGARGERGGGGAGDDDGRVGVTPR